MVIRAMTLKELAVAYRVSRSTMRRWLTLHTDEIGRRPDGRQAYTARQVEIIYQVLDLPELETLAK